MQEASPSGRPEDVLPVLVLGTDWLGWVERHSCRPFSLTSGQSALTSAWAAITDDGGGGCRRPLMREEQPLLACVRGLKLAAEFCSMNSACMANQAMGAPLPAALDAARGWAAEVSCRYSTTRLLELEGQLPPGAMLNSSFAFWANWRRSVQAASSPHQLSSQVSTV